MHGGNLRRAKELYGLDSFVDLSANINPFGPPRGVWASLQQAMPEIVHYPDPESKALRETLSRQLGLPFEMIMVGNGAGELIFTIVQALKPQKVAIPIPTFSEYERAARAVGSDVSYIPLGPEGWDRFNRSQADRVNVYDEEVVNLCWREHLKGCDLLFLCSPHNPTGSILDQDKFRELLLLTKELGCRILVDESFLDFLAAESRVSARQYLTTNEHLIVLYSLTKFYSLPGLRLGTVLASKSLLAMFEQYRDPWSVNVLAQQAGITALLDTKFPEDVREKLKASKAFFYREFALNAFPFLRLWPSSVNFALIEVLNHSSKDLIQHLGEQGILVRDCSSFSGLTGEFIRVAIKEMSVMQKLLDGLKGFKLVAAAKTDIDC